MGFNTLCNINPTSGTRISGKKYHRLSSGCDFENLNSETDGMKSGTVRFALPAVGLPIVQWTEFIVSIKTSVIEKDEERVFQMGDRVVSLCYQSLVASDLTLIHTLIKLADWVLDYDMRVEAYTLYERAMVLSVQLGFDDSHAFFAWLGLAKLLKVGGMAKSDSDLQIADEIFAWLSSEYDSSEAKSFLS